MNKAKKTKIHTIAPKLRSGEYKLVQRHGRSVVWRIFSGIADQDDEELQNFVYCTKCEKVYKCHQHSTSNLIKHASSHLKKDETADEKLEESNTKVFERNANRLTELLTTWVIRNCVPYDAVSSGNLKAVFEAFTRLDADAYINNTMLTSSECTSKVSEIYEQCLDIVRTDLAAVKRIGFGLTTDIWTNDFTGATYIAITIHYLMEGVLTFRLLRLTTLEEEMGTNEAVIEQMQETLKDFDLQLTGKSILLTFAIDKITKKYPDTPIITCISQLLQNVLRKSIDETPEIAEIVNTCFKLVNSLNKLKLYTFLGDSVPSSYPSQWEYIYGMLKAVESNWTEIEETRQKQSKTINIQYLKAVLKTFEPFQEAIEALEDDSCATLHLVMVYLHELRKSCSTNDSEFIDFECVESLKKNLRFNLKQMVSENITILHKLALFLYPPTNKLLQFSDKEKQCVEQECLRKMKYFQNDMKMAIKQDPDSSKRLKLFEDFVELKADSDPNKLINEELQSYKNTYVPNTVDFDVFRWWKVQKNNFPLLYKLSCIVLAIPATSAVTKRLFSTAKSLLCDKSKTDINDVDVEKIIFTNVNAKDGEIP